MATKYPVEFKLSAIHYFLSGHAGIDGTAKHFSIAPTNLRRWVARYQHHGEQALLPRGHRRYSSDFRVQVAHYDLAHPGESYAAVAARFNLTSYKTVESWARQYSLKGHYAFPPENSTRSIRMSDKAKSPKPAGSMTEKELLKELEYLRAENDYLKVMQEIILEKKRREREKKPLQ